MIWVLIFATMLTVALFLFGVAIVTAVNDADALELAEQIVTELDDEAGRWG